LSNRLRGYDVPYVIWGSGLIKRNTEFAPANP
jgi:hypothetical protein